MDGWMRIVDIINGHVVVHGNPYSFKASCEYIHLKEYRTAFALGAIRTTSENIITIIITDIRCYIPGHYDLLTSIMAIIWFESIMDQINVIAKMMLLLLLLLLLQ